MSGVNQYLHNVETTDRVPPYHNEAYQYETEYAQQRPAIIEMNFPQEIYLDPTTIQTCAGKTKTLYKAKIPPFLEFQSNVPIDFILHDFHNYFDGLIGLQDLINAKLDINLLNQTLDNDYVQIPLNFREDFSSCSYDLNPLEIRRIKIPVVVENGPVLNPEFHSTSYYVPETLSTSTNYLAEVEVHNLTNIHKLVSFTEPQRSIPFEEQKKRNF
ncbi:hypothetical protein NQ314_005374 [Rhamnusium bicolor]|uniref:Uncharacterized protein n=1 Tax=Rhamnusium bicolor TaxID=1586634 RepID=A0AAV8ZI80_9CUCU|nr:hypothetical protein NQ314_005374 [Rhamnusium bicolor]